MAQSPNQFSQTPVQGQLDLRFNTNVIACQVDVSSAGGLVAGQPVKMVNSAGGVPKIVECAADTDDVFGFIAYDIKDRVFNALQPVEIAAMHDNVMYMTSSAAIARNASVEIVIAGIKVATAVATKRIVGRALDAATGADQLIRVTIELPGAIAP